MEKLVKKYDRSPVHTDIRSLAPIKITLDDLLCQFLRVEGKYKQSNLATDIRIVIGLLSTAMSILLTYLSINKDFKDYKLICLFIVVSYFSLNILLDLLMRIFVRGCIFRSKGFNKLSVFTNINSPDTNYVVMAYKNGKVIPEKYNIDVRDLFRQDGTLVHKKFFDDLKTFFKDEEGKKSKDK